MTGGSGTLVPLLVPVVVVEPPQCFHLQWPPDDELVDVLPVLELLVLLDVELLEDVELLLLPDEEPDELELLLELPELLPEELPLVELQCFLQ
ncbi:MAG TPA: hypothetical protein VL100_04405 [Croceibacterium sp.]|nr:hypothetical protein [Croceibacterium sp.]